MRYWKFFENKGREKQENFSKINKGIALRI